MSRFFSDSFLTARLISRPNRFVVRIEIDGIDVGASLPNPGKLGELFIPGVTLYVVSMRPEVKYPYRVIAVESYSGEVIMLDTHTNNKIAEYLVNSQKIPSLKDYHVKKREVTVGHSRFDLLLENGKKELLYCEVKSCTLFGGDLAMFPDAVTSRGKRHVEVLGEMGKSGIQTAVVFVIQSNNIQYFLPDFHTDPLFSEALYLNRNHIKIIPILAGWNQQLDLISKEIEVPVLWDLYEKEGRSDSGSYIMLCQITDNTFLDMKDLGGSHLKKGYYCFVGSEESELKKKIERHKRKRKNCIHKRDYLRNISEIDTVWPIRSKTDMSDKISSSLKEISNYEIPEFDSRLFYFENNPKLMRNFQELLLDYRMRFFIRDKM